MKRSEAAAILGVPVDADEGTVQAAFRSRARELHPDRDGSGDLDQLARARDTLIAPEPEPDHLPRSRTAITYGQPAAPRPAPEAAPASNDGVSMPGCRRLVAITLAVGVVIIVAVIIAAIALTGGDEPEPIAPATSCVRVDGPNVTEVDCTATGAQEVLSRFTGRRTCADGENTLIAGSTTWCLGPVGP
ncbi:MAG: J domain-containing protein [Actinomycetota bacterium]